MLLRSLRQNLCIPRMFRRCPINPFADTLAFLTPNEWPIYVFWLLPLGSLGIAVVNGNRQRILRLPHELQRRIDAWPSPSASV
jgi:hypothetical protein